MCQLQDYQLVESQSALAPLDPKQISCTDYWGTEYFLHTKYYPKMNYFISMLQKNARYALPLLRLMTNFMNDSEQLSKPTPPLRQPAPPVKKATGNADIAASFLAGDTRPDGGPMDQPIM